MKASSVFARYRRQASKSMRFYSFSGLELDLNRDQETRSSSIEDHPALSLQRRAHTLDIIDEHVIEKVSNIIYAHVLKFDILPKRR
jgi:hypothetical protein